MQSILTGRGELKDDGQRLGEAEYKIHLTQGPVLRSGSGMIYADAETLMAAFEARRLTIRREDTGRDISIIVRSYTHGAHADIVLNGSPN